MILTHSVKVCLATEPCDLRKSFETLSAVVREKLGEDPLSKTVFVFINRARNRVKLSCSTGMELDFGFWKNDLSAVISAKRKGFKARNVS
jgi:transposase